MEITGNFPRRACVLIRFSRVWLCDPMDRVLLCPFTTTEVLEGYPHCHHRPLCAGASFCLRFLLPALSAQSLRMPKYEPVQLRANSRPLVITPRARGSTLHSGGLLPASLRGTQRSLTWLCFLRPHPAMFLLLALLAALGGLLASPGKTAEPRLPSPSSGYWAELRSSWGAISVALGYLPPLPGILWWRLPPTPSPPRTRIGDGRC